MGSTASWDHHDPSNSMLHSLLSEAVAKTMTAQPTTAATQKTDGSSISSPALGGRGGRRGSGPSLLASRQHSLSNQGALAWGAAAADPEGDMAAAANGQQPLGQQGDDEDHGEEEDDFFGEEGQEGEGSAVVEALFGQVTGRGGAQERAFCLVAPFPSFAPSLPRPTVAVSVEPEASGDVGGTGPASGFSSPPRPCTSPPPRFCPCRSSCRSVTSSTLTHPHLPPCPAPGSVPTGAAAGA